MTTNELVEKLETHQRPLDMAWKVTLEDGSTVRYEVHVTVQRPLQGLFGWMRRAVLGLV